jgi:hypothetical protein
LKWACDRGGLRWKKLTSGGAVGWSPAVEFGRWRSGAGHRGSRNRWLGWRIAEESGRHGPLGRAVTHWRGSSWSGVGQRLELKSCAARRGGGVEVVLLPTFDGDMGAGR